MYPMETMPVGLVCYIHRKEYGRNDLGIKYPATPDVIHRALNGGLVNGTCIGWSHVYQQIAYHIQRSNRDLDWYRPAVICDQSKL